MSDWGKMEGEFQRSPRQPNDPEDGNMVSNDAQIGNNATYQSTDDRQRELQALDQLLDEGGLAPWVRENIEHRRRQLVCERE